MGGAQYELCEALTSNMGPRRGGCRSAGNDKEAQSGSRRQRIQIQGTTLYDNQKCGGLR